MSFRSLARALALSSVTLLLCACSALSQPTATPSPTHTATPTVAPSPTQTRTPTPSPSPSPTLPPSPIPTASATPTPSATPLPSATPSITPMPAPGFVFDNWDVAEIPPAIAGGLAGQTLVFSSSNNRQTIANIATAQPFTGAQSVYFVSPTGSRRRHLVLGAQSSRALEVFPAPSGRSLAYVKDDSDPRSSGLYLLNLATGFSARILPGANPLAQRGYYSPPSWSPDGQQLALAYATGYDIDISLVSIDGTTRRNISNHGAYDIYPRVSPDGSQIAFLSDRATCPSWRPGEPGFCDALTQPPPAAFHLYLHSLASGETRQVAELPVSEPPAWISAELLAFASGDPFDLLNPRRSLWRANIKTGEVIEIRSTRHGPDASYLSEVWSPDGSLVLAQVVGEVNSLALLDAAGQLLGSDAELNFPRYSLRASWSPDGQRIALGGTGGACPYGVRVKNLAFQNVAQGNPPPSMCDPMFSPDGQFIAFTGVNPAVDGRNDIYVASYNGFGATSLTRDLRGQVALIGWVEPS